MKDFEKMKTSELLDFVSKEGVDVEEADKALWELNTRLPFSLIDEEQAETGEKVKKLKSAFKEHSHSEKTGKPVVPA